jgi:hypothetical protein
MTELDKSSGENKLTKEYGNRLNSISQNTSRLRRNFENME